MSAPLELDLNPRAAQMADEPMVRNLAAQARCIWRAHFESMRDTLRDPSGYGVWFVPVVADRKPAAMAGIARARHHGRDQ